MKESIAQFVKDGRHIRVELLIWLVMTVLIGICSSPWFVRWATMSPDSSFDVLKAPLLLTFLILVITMWTVAHRLIMSDHPLATDEFWMSRPVRPSALVASKAA